MSHKNIDYSNTTIYKIICNDETTEYIYVGHTTNLVKIKCQHKSYTENPKFNSILYQTIRKHGGWLNWTIYPIETLDCKTLQEVKLKTKQHLIKLQNNNKINNYRNQPNISQQLFVCECGKEYKHRQSLNTHKYKCEKHREPKKNTEFGDNGIIISLLNQNNQLQQQIIEMCKENKVITINNHESNIISHNKTFNINVFLNETCKDAMNITDFVDSLKLQLSDLESVGKLGYIEGISNIIVKNLKELDVYKRPLHCSDSKRDVMYIKDENKWERENEENTKLRRVIKKIADKNSRLIPVFKAKYPECIKSISPYSDEYNNLLIQSMGGNGDNDREKEDKIIKKISKNVFIDKNCVM